MGGVTARLVVHQKDHLDISKNSYKSFIQTLRFEASEGDKVKKKGNFVTWTW